MAQGARARATQGAIRLYLSDPAASDPGEGAKVMADHAAIVADPIPAKVGA